ncbi:MAG: chemotaxis protein CheW, partial [Spirochaetota bacterium]|nr:chemotaxis protein CheW [Spirochaetota bacterium]
MISENFHELVGNHEYVSELDSKRDQLSNIAKMLQEGIMQSRMVPIGTVFSRFTRLIRDLSKNLDKKVEIAFRGEETELDKKIIDVIGDPLIHLIRNSIDHGLESISERQSAGKKDTGKITLNAYQSGNYIFVEVSDDGRGLNKERIVNKAIEKNMISQEESKNLSETDIYGLIFHPGFSTKTEITAISGRGVGMDVVVDTVKSLNGSVAVRSEDGKGSTFTLSFPLTLAIVPAILIESGIETYAIPLSNVVETIKINQSEVQTVDFQEVIRLRDQVIPILRLDIAFDIQRPEALERLSIVISEFEGQAFGVVVDNLLGKREIVIKSLSKDYKEMRGISGATILGNGQIALILDIPGLIRQSRDEGYSITRGKRKNKVIKRIDHEQSKLMNLKVQEEDEVKQQVLKAFDLDERSYAMVKEMFKIALATSSNNVKRFLNKDVVLAIPDLDVHHVNNVKSLSKFLGDEKMYFCSVDFTESLNGKLIIALDDVGMDLLFRDLVAGQPMDSDVGQACIMEIGNLLMAGVTNTISRALGLRSYPSPPNFQYDTYKNYFTSLFESHREANNKYIWTIDTDIIVEDTLVKGKVYIFPYDTSFKEISKGVLNKQELFSYMVEG